MSVLEAILILLWDWARMLTAAGLFVGVVWVVACWVGGAFRESTGQPAGESEGLDDAGHVLLRTSPRRQDDHPMRLADRFHEERDLEACWRLPSAEREQLTEAEREEVRRMAYEIRALLAKHAPDTQDSHIEEAQSGQPTTGSSAPGANTASGNSPRAGDAGASAAQEDPTEAGGDAPSSSVGLCDRCNAPLDPADEPQYCTRPRHCGTGECFTRCDECQAWLDDSGPRTW